MPKIYDNIENHLNEGLLKTLESSYKADFCVGYFYLKGWKLLQDRIDNFKGGEECCRLLVGMQRPTDEVIKEVIYHIDNGLMDGTVGDFPPIYQILKHQPACAIVYCSYS